MGADVLYGIENIVASQYDDTLQTDGNSNTVRAGGGNDILTLSSDGIWASGYVAANQGLPGSAATGQQVSIEGKVRFADVLDGGEGTADTLRLTSGHDAFFLHDAYSLFNTDAVLANDARGMASSARVIGIEVIMGGAGDDIIDLTSTDYTIGGVRIDSGSGNDVLWGNAGNDVLQGGKGNDTLFGGSGTNTLNGGEGADVFQYAKGGNAVDTIEDFEAGIDKMVLFGAASTSEVTAALKVDHVTLTWDTQTIELIGITSTTGFGDWLQLA